VLCPSLHYNMRNRKANGKDRESKEHNDQPIDPLGRDRRAFALGIFLGRGTWLFDAGQDERAVQRALSGEEFAFIRPTITEAKPDLRKIRELKPFRYKVDALIKEKLDSDEATAVSVYFRDLDNGNWFGIRENEKFSPESQLKIPILIAYSSCPRPIPSSSGRRSSTAASAGLSSRIT